jgi:hypothetical protein
VNFFAGPGAGKSTTRAKTFGLFKDNKVNVEEVTEFAKDLTWDQNKAALADQLYILGTQNRRQYRLQGQVEWCITDCPLLLGAHYATPDFLPNTFKNLIFELWDTYENYNFFIKRTKPYSPVGRSQNEAEARAIDDNIRKMLVDHEIPFIEVADHKDLYQEIYDLTMHIDHAKFSPKL